MVKCNMLRIPTRTLRLSSAISNTLSRTGSRLACATMTTTKPDMTSATKFSFGPHTVYGTEVFALTDLSFAFVNLKPVVPGHVLVSPLRVAKRFADLTKEEVSDMWLLAQRVGSVIEPHFQCNSLTMAIQDGASAGQTVPHVHIHILPRKSGDFAVNDEVYDAIDAAAKDMRAAAAGEKLDLDKQRTIRTPQEMADEAAVLRALMQG